MLLSSQDFRRAWVSYRNTVSLQTGNNSSLALFESSRYLISKVLNATTPPLESFPSSHLYLIYSERLQTRSGLNFPFSFTMRRSPSPTWGCYVGEGNADSSEPAALYSFFMFGSNLLQTHGWCSLSSFLSLHASMGLSDLSETSGSRLNKASALSQRGQILQEDTLERTCW